ERRAPALLTAALFAVHPIATEAVTYIVGRADLLAALSVLGGLLLYVRGLGVTGRRKLLWLLLLFFISLFGVLCKENSVMLLGVMILYDVAWRGERKQARWLERLAGYIAAGLPVAVALGVRSFAYARPGPLQFPFVDNPLHGVGFWEARLTAVKV